MGTFKAEIDGLVDIISMAASLQYRYNVVDYAQYNLHLKQSQQAKQWFLSILSFGKEGSEYTAWDRTRDPVGFSR